jgi:hypothetical protein
MASKNYKPNVINQARLILECSRHNAIKNMNSRVFKKPKDFRPREDRDRFLKVRDINIAIILKQGITYLERNSRLINFGLCGVHIPRNIFLDVNGRSIGEGYGDVDDIGCYKQFMFEVLDIVINPNKEKKATQIKEVLDLMFGGETFEQSINVNVVDNITTTHSSQPKIKTICLDELIQKEQEEDSKWEVELQASNNTHTTTSTPTSIPSISTSPICDDWETEADLLIEQSTSKPVSNSVSYLCKFCNTSSENICCLQCRYMLPISYLMEHQCFPIEDNLVFQTPQSSLPSYLLEKLSV